MRVLVSVSVHRLTAVLTGTMLGCILTTYSLCIHESHCPRFLPMISDTWVYPPGTYLSRLTLTVVAFGLAVVYTAYYFRQVLYGSPAFVEAVVLRIALVGCVSMCIVGAVCENPVVKSCDVGIFFGVHVAAAMLTFGIATLYSMRAIRMLPMTRSNLPLHLLVAGSIMCKLRWILHAWYERAPGHLEALSSHLDLIVPILEWCDCLFLLAFFTIYSTITMCGFRVAYVRQQLVTQDPDASDNIISATGRDELLMRSPTTELAWLAEKPLVAVVQRMVHMTVATTFCFSWIDGTVHPMFRWPALSDMWVSPPSNIISRFMVCLGALVCGLSQVSHAYLSDSVRQRCLLGYGYRLNSLLHSLSYTGLAGLAIVGACNLDENLALHTVGSSLFFGMHILYFGLDALWSAPHARRHTTALAITAWLLSVLAGAGLFARAAGVDQSLRSVHMGPLDLVNMCEWACLGAFTVLLKTSTDAFDGQPRVHIALLGPTHLLVPRSPHNDDAVVLHTAFDLTGKQDGKLQVTSNLKADDSV